MKYFFRLTDDIDISQALVELENYSHLWGQDTGRTIAPNSPRADTQDIWLRFRDRAELINPTSYNEPHFAMFYPAWYALPGMQAITFQIMRRVRANYLGDVILSKIPPGKAIHPHIDTGWRAGYLTCKVCVPLQSNGDCINECGNEAIVMLPGSAWMFENRVTHSVSNNGETDEIAMTLAMRNM